ALEQRRRLVPAPRDLEREDRGDEKARHPHARREREDAERDREREERQHEDQVPRLRRRVPPEAPDEEEERRRQRHARREQRRLGAVARELHDPDQGENEEEDQRRGVARRRVAGDVPQVGEDLARRAQLPAATAEADVEAAREDEAAAPERDREDEDGREGRHRLA